MNETSNKAADQVLDKPLVPLVRLSMARLALRISYHVGATLARSNSRGVTVDDRRTAIRRLPSVWTLLH